MSDDSYTKWLKAEVQEALDDPRPSVPHDEAMRQVRASLVRITTELKAKYRDNPEVYDELMREAKATLERGAAEFKAKFLADRAAAQGSEADVFSPKS